MDDLKPWEDESLKGAYHQEKKRQASVRMNFKKKAARPFPKKEPTLTGALGQAYKFKQRNEKIDQLTKPLRKSATGGTE
jgi:hypothetical protein